jgi:bile acid:Na+ symporter, BASS family
MDLATLIPLVVKAIPLVLKASILLTVFTLGLKTSIEDVLSLLRRPSLLLRSLLAMSVVMPLLAVALDAAFKFHPAVEIALVALALSPVPPVLPKKELKAGGSSSYGFGLLVVAGLFAIVFVPLALEVVERVFSVPLQLSPGQVAQIILLTVLAPLGLGLLVRTIAPPLAERIAKPLSSGATVLLLAGALPILFTKWPAIVSLIGNGTLAAIVVFILVGLTAGHLLGGPDPADRTVLALSTASRHPGVALAIASANFPQAKLVLPAVLLYLITGAILTIPYLKWRKSKTQVAGPPIPR